MLTVTALELSLHREFAFGQECLKVSEARISAAMVHAWLAYQKGRVSLISIWYADAYSAWCSQKLVAGSTPVV